VRLSAVEALEKIGALATDSLIVALHDANTTVRERASVALIKIGAPAIESLIVTLRDQNADTRRLAAIALGKIGDRRALPELDHLAQEGEGKTDEDQRAAFTARVAIENIRQRMKTE
ncbi:MAG: HEAT repeat domain-containing protein, partial [Chloroflexota bacterium]|nr:HEAT repeat domain-containing protein [Chloroflexota bacterium]